MVKDPVCKMEVDERSARYRSSYAGETYYFCSPGCKREFDTNPERYSGQSTYRAAASEKAGQFAQKARETGEQITGKAQSQAKSMAAERKGQAAEKLGSVAHALRQTAQQLHGQQQSAVARYADSAAEKVDQFSTYLREQNIDKIIGDAEDFARRQPGLFLGGAFFAGLALSRFLKSSRTASTGSRPVAVPAEAEGEAAG